ncbi:Mediator of RNA polymerase II transcription subunit 6 [Acorus gramineus]|uniref:Mediator of RNA polymerase II transcription subunit 6 n=1 Tax=Acorus gramineus TaxID=55184 RepID=A0AAV9ALG0_ACOGR|nr:Mediator of RNA polymerase II transcription subunit 6 [Acorus gramineus]
MATPAAIGDLQPPAPPQTPGTDMTGICFRDQLWLNTYPLDRNLVFDYFALSPFYDWSSNNEQLRSRSIHPLDLSQLSKMTGIEYILNEVMEPHLFVIRKQRRDGPEKVTPMLTYYILDGSIYQAPQLCNVFASRITYVGVLRRVSAKFTFCGCPGMCVDKGCIYDLKESLTNAVVSHFEQVSMWQARATYHISKAFTIAASKLEKIGFVDGENESVSSETKPVKEMIDFKEVKRVDHILGSLLRKLPPAPPPPPFPEGYVPPQTTETENTTEAQQPSESQLPPDPIVDQGPSKRVKYQ